MKSTKKFLFIVASLLCLLVYAAGFGNKQTHPRSPNVLGEVTRMRINNIDIPLRNDGAVFEADGKPGYYPSGQTTLGFLFSGGFGISGYVNGQLRASWMATTSLLEDWLPGKWGMDPQHPLARFYEVSVNDEPGSLAYIDWADAVSLGADFVDLNGDGVYDSYIDKPAVLGDKTIWTVFNDSTLNTYPGGLGTQPFGIEIQQAVWAYQRGEYLQDVIFFWHRIINTSSDPIDSLIFSVWEDPDIGDYIDDLVGCDTTMILGYCYNDGDDNNYGSNPPAFGIRLLQGPLASSPGDTAYVFQGIGKGIDTLLGMKNLPMTSFMHYVYGGAILNHPQNVQTARYYQEGGQDVQGNPIDPTQWGIGGTPTTDPTFFYSGDPVTLTGWLDSSPSDKLFMVNCGPFTLAAGDIQDIVFAYTVGRGSDALNSISVLRQRASYLENFFPAGRLLDIVVNDTLISTDSTFVFEPLLFNLAFNDTIQLVNWELITRPPGSGAQLSSGPGFQASLDPDLPGAYTVTAQATVSGGHLLTDTLTAKAVDNHPPIAQLTIDPAEMIFGQATMADAGASYDPDGDALTYSWTLPNWVSGVFPDSAVIHFTPLHTGSAMAEVDVSDPFFQVPAKSHFTVSPLVNGLDAVDSLSSLIDLYDIKYDTGFVYALQYTETAMESLIVLDAGNLSTQVGGGLVDGEKFVIDGTTLAAYRSDVNLYEMDANFQLIHKSMIDASIIQGSDIYLKDNILFIPNYPWDLLIYDISNLASPVQIGTYSLPPITRDVAFEDSIAVVYSPILGVATFDISDYSNITLLDTLGISIAFQNIAYANGRIYARNTFGGGNNEVLIIDARQPDNLQLAASLQVESIISGYDPSPIIEMEAQDDFLILGTSDGVKIYDVSDPYQPFERVNRHTGLPVQTTAWHKPYLYAAIQGDSSFGGGLYKMEWDSTFVVSVDDHPIAGIFGSFQLFQNYPNPFNPETVIRYCLPSASRVELTVYNILGQKVKTLASGVRQAGESKERWDGTNEAGMQVASGVYIYRLQANNFVQSRKMLLLR